MSSPRSKSGLLLHGDRVGRYRVLTHVADGGMAAVYLAELDGPSAFSKQVALKVIHRHLMADEGFVGMFMDEARIAARLHHPNIVQTFDLVQTEDHLAIAMEYAPGMPAAALLPGHGRTLALPITPELVAYLGAEIAAGLHHAHTLTDNQGDALGIIHRDVSPMNVHIGYDGRVRLVDFGIARARGRLATTGHGLVKGTFAYVSPEQFTGVEPTARSDVWSLGVVLWELLAGRRLFRRDTEADTARAVMNDPIPAAETLRHDFPLPLGIAIHRALERDPARRWPSARAMEDVLREVLPAKLEVVRAPLLEALSPHRDQHFDELRALLADQDIESLETVHEDPSVEIPIAREAAGDASAPAPAPERGVSSTDATPMAAADLGLVPRSRPPRWAVLGVAGAALLLLVTLIGVSGPDREAPRAPRSSARVTRQEEPAPTPAPPPPPARVSLEVTSSVPGARVFLDDRLLGDAPVRTVVDRDPAEHVLRVEAEGRAPQEQRVTLDAPVQLALDPRAPAEAPSAPGPRRWRKTLTFDRNVYR